MVFLWFVLVLDGWHVCSVKQSTLPWGVILPGCASDGSDHLNMAAIGSNPCSVLQALGDLQGAKEHFERALEIFRKFLGEEHPFTATVRDNLESLANVQGRVEPGSDQN